MPSLTELVEVIPLNTDEEVEDIFASASRLIFPDDLRTQHGDPGSTIVYKSPRFGDIELRTADPQGEDERSLFSHYLWNAGIKLAGLISDPHGLEWSVQGESVLELGAGVGLVGIIAILAGASSVVMSDYPAPVVLDNIRNNVERAIPASLASTYLIQGHEWGEFDSSFAQEYKHSFTRILAADCFWMPWQHENLVVSMMHFLKLGNDGEVFALAAFHTGRAKLANFFNVAVEAGLKIEQIYEEDHEGRRRPWLKERDGGREDHNERKKWLVIARLRRA